jgi:hypothetical protein
LDFSNICEDVQPLILQHFTTKNLLQMSEVSKAWNNQLEGKISEKTCVNGLKLLDKDFALQIFKVNKESQKFKQVSFKLGTESEKVVGVFTGTVENLKIKVNFTGAENVVRFPKLKVLELEIVSLRKMKETYSWLNDIEARKVQELKLSIRDDLRTSSVATFLNGLAKLITNMQNLKKLDLSGYSRYTVDRIFNRNRRPVVPKFELECLKSPGFLDFSYSYESLKTLMLLDGFSEQKIREILEMFEKLETLEVENCMREWRLWPQSFQPFPVNTMIKNLSLELEVVYDPPPALVFFELATKLLTAVPELETFYVTELTTNLMMFAAANNFKLKQMKYESIEEGTLEKYEEMCQGEGVVNRDIKFIQN